MVYFPCKFHFSFALDGFCQTAEKVTVSILSMGFFAIFLFLLCVGALHLGQLLKKLQFRCFSHCRKASFLWFHCAKGTKASFFRPLARFPAEFEHVTTYKQMAYGLFSLQFSRFSFAFWAASAKMLKKLQFPCFSHCSKASLLWFHCAKGTKPSFFRPLPRFPAEFEHVTTYKQMAYGLFSLQCSRFSFALGGFC